MTGMLQIDGNAKLLIALLGLGYKGTDDPTVGQQMRMLLIFSSKSHELL